MTTLYTCESCDYSTKDPHNFKRHKKTQKHRVNRGNQLKTVRRYHCTFCDKKIKTHKNYRYHMKSHYEEYLLDNYEYCDDENAILDIIKQVIYVYNDNKLKAQDMFNFDYYFDDYYNLSLDDKNEFMNELIDNYNDYILIKHPMIKYGSRKKLYNEKYALLDIEFND